MVSSAIQPARAQPAGPGLPDLVRHVLLRRRPTPGRATPPAGRRARLMPDLGITAMAAAVSSGIAEPRAGKLARVDVRYDYSSASSDEVAAVIGPPGCRCLDGGRGAESACCDGHDGQPAAG